MLSISLFFSCQLFLCRFLLIDAVTQHTWFLYLLNFMSLNIPTSRVIVRWSMRQLHHRVLIYAISARVNNRLVRCISHSEYRYVADRLWNNIFYRLLRNVIETGYASAARNGTRLSTINGRWWYEYNVTWHFMGTSSGSCTDSPCKPLLHKIYPACLILHYTTAN